MKKAFSAKYWEGDTVYYETVGFRYDKDGAILCGKLLFEPDKILSVTKPDWVTPYVEGKDYILSGRQFSLPEGSSIPVYPYDRNQPKFKGEPMEPVWAAVYDDPSRFISIDPGAYEFQICVSYTHKDAWDGFTPVSQKECLPRTFGKLENGETLRVVYFGDSIEAGWEASGVDENVIGMRRGEPGPIEFHLVHDRAPYVPAWPTLVTTALREAYPEANVIHINRSCGGMATPWGIRVAKELVCAKKPDLVVLGFGMNQADHPVEEFITDIRKIMEIIREDCPECEFLLLSPMQPNPDAKPYRHHVLYEQEKALEALAPDFGAAVAPVHSMFRALLERGKTHADITGNNINHPNDFSVRLYFQTIAASLGL